MASTSQPKGRDGLLSALDVFIRLLDLAKGASGIPPAHIAFASASELLTMIRVRFLVLREDELLTRIHLGHDGQLPGLRRPRQGLR